MFLPQNPGSFLEAILIGVQVSDMHKGQSRCLSSPSAISAPVTQFFLQGVSLPDLTALLGVLCHFLLDNTKDDTTLQFSFSF